MKRIALLIGISKYEPEFQDLPSAVKDVKAIQKILQDPNTGLFDKEDIIVLIPESQEEVQAELDELPQEEIPTELNELTSEKKTNLYR